MKRFQFLLRQAGAASKADVFLQAAKLAAVVYQIGFALYLPVAKYVTEPAIPRYRWFIVYLLAAVYAQAFPYIPKVGQKRRARADAARLRSTNAAISQITACIREARFGSMEFLDISHRLLVAIRLEVEAIILDSDGTYVNATLMVEDALKPDHLIVRSRANTDRVNESYAKEGLVVWKAMTEQYRRYEPIYNQDGKDYHCILALPLVIGNADGSKKSIGVVSIDSGRANDFDGSDEEIELRLLPYLSLLKLLLSIEKGGRSNGE